jgi:CRP-like cAMP-binding protein
LTARKRPAAGPGPDVVARKLSQHSVLSEASRQALSLLLGHPGFFPKGHLIAKAGDPPDVISIVESGFACRMTILPTGVRQIQAILLQGDVADVEASLLRRRNDNLQALSACSVWLVPKSRLAALPRVEGGLSEAFLREATINAEIAREWIVNLGRRTADQRIAHLVCELCTRMDLVGVGADGAYPFVFTQQDISDAQGLTAVHVNRIMQQLKARGLIDLKARSLTILDRPGLERLGMFDPGFLHLRQRSA